MPALSPRTPLPRDFWPAAAAALAGVVLFRWIGLPAAALSGAMVGVTLLAAAGRKASMPSWLAGAGMLMSGVAMGASVTPELFAAAAAYPLSLALLGASLLATMLLTQAFLVRVGRWDGLTALLAATPGALTTVMAVAAETKADAARILVVQSVRLFMLVAVLPPLVAAAGAGGLPAPRPTAGAQTLALLCVAGVAVAWPLARVGFAAPWIFGGMAGAAALSVLGLAGGEPPRWFEDVAFGLVGFYIGTRFAAISRRELLGALALSQGALVVGLAVTVVFAAALHGLTGFPIGTALVAYAPGGLEAMLVLGAALGLDPLYLSLHHMIRFFGIGLLLPLAMPWLRRNLVPRRDDS